MYPIEMAPLAERPLVSILVANYNKGRYVGRAIESALNQTYDNIQLVVCDDGSTDDSRRIIDAFAARDSRMVVLRQPNAGHPAAYNKAYDNSQGDIIVILDSDDYCHPRRVERIVQTFREKPEVGFVIHPMLMVDGEGNYIQPVTLIDSFEEGWIADKIVRRGGRWRNMTASGISLRRDLARFIYPVPHGIWADIIFNTLLPLVTHVAVIREYLSYYRLHGDQLTNEIRDFSSWERSVKSTERFVYQISYAIGQANARIHEAGIDAPPIDIDRNLEYRIRLHALKLLKGGRWRDLWRSYLALFAQVRSDDLYGQRTKIILLTAYGVALLLPRKLRAPLVEILHQPNPLKRFMLRRYTTAAAQGLQNGAVLSEAGMSSPVRPVSQQK